MGQSIGWTEVNINPKIPVLQKGFIQQTTPITEVKDCLNARICRIISNQLDIIWINIDSIGYDIHQFRLIETKIKELYGANIIVVLSATHTHFAGDPSDPYYFDYMVSVIVDGISNIKMKTGELSYSHRYTDEIVIGKSRISGHTAKTLLSIVTICCDSVPYVNLLSYNCHPTVLDGNTDFFSHEYPGAVLEVLHKTYKGQKFLFLQGPAGDVSTRFYRKDQSYSEMVRLSKIVVKSVVNLLENPVDSNPVVLNFKDGFIQLQHELRDFSRFSFDTKTQREIETINYGRIIQKNIEASFDLLPDYLRYSVLTLGEFKFILFPNELFSEYIDYIDVNKTSIVCYSQGYAPYVSGFRDVGISYELFSDTYTNNTKERIKSVLEEESKGEL